MAKVTFKPEAGVSDETEQFGFAFAGGEAVEVPEGSALAKFRGNPFFDVEEEAPKPKKEKATVEGLRAVHIAGGRFKIVDGDKVIKEGLNKADADAFNAMSDEDKAEYVAE